MTITKKNIYTIDLLCQIEILLLNMQKLFKIPGFFSLNCQIPGFLATLKQPI